MVRIEPSQCIQPHGIHECPRTNRIEAVDRFLWNAQDSRSRLQHLTRSGGEFATWVQLVAMTSKVGSHRNMAGTDSPRPTANRTICRSHLGEKVEHMATNGDQPRQPEPIDRRRLFLNSAVFC